MEKTPNSLWFAAGFLSVLFLALATNVQAATYTEDCPTEDESCAALAERLEVAVSVLEEIRDTPPPDSSEISGTVALSETDRGTLGDIRRGMGWQIGLILSIFAGMLLFRGIGSA